jgi:hypothetical protein
MIPTALDKETEFISDSNLNSLKRHYMTFYWRVSKDFLDQIEDSMSHDILIGSTISTRSKKNVSCASTVPSPNVQAKDVKWHEEMMNVKLSYFKRLENLEE